MLEAIGNNIQTNARRQYDYRETIVASQRINWRIEDIIGGDRRLDFTKPFLPEVFAGVEKMSFLYAGEKLILNQIRGHAYLSIFGLVEEFILPFVLDHVRPSLDTDDDRVQAFLQFAGEEAKHIQLFKRFSREFQDNFGTRCAVIGPPSEVAKAVLSHQPLAIALIILHIEWMTQRHYIETIKDSRAIDAQFKNLLRHHWMEEAQHAKLDTLMIEAIAERMSADEIEKAVDEYLEIVRFLDAGLKQQTALDLDAFERAANRRLTAAERENFLCAQHQANRRTYLGSGMTHSGFLATLGKLSSKKESGLKKLRPLFAEQKN